MASIVRRLQESMHCFQHVVRQVAVGPVWRVGADRVDHVGQTDAATVLGVTMAELDFLPLTVAAAMQTNWTTECVRIGNAQRAFGAIYLDAGHLGRPDIERCRQ